MFLAAAKLAAVEALRSTFDDDYPRLKPKRIDIEYPEVEDAWPAIFVQFRPGNAITWTGLNPDEFDLTLDPNFDWRRYRKGHFEGSYDFTVLALSSAERDRIWDSLVETILMGELSPAMNDFHKTINEHELIDLTILRSQVTPLGDSVGMGTPWGSEELTYEATIRIAVTGEFWADADTEELLSLTDVRAFPYHAGETPYGSDDDQGPWRKFSGVAV